MNLITRQRLVEGLRLVRDYQHAVARVVRELQAYHGVEDLLSARESGAIPSAGEAPFSFTFHGIGCRAHVDGSDVDFDFGPDRRIDGFDAWRLSIFVNGYASSELDDERIRGLLLDLARAGLVDHPRAAPGPHLWYLTDVGRAWIRELPDA